MKRTWDGKPVSAEKPFGATVIVFRFVQTELQVLILHRAYNPPDYEGDWAWTPPSGARYPGEDIEACAIRELLEETGLEIPLQHSKLGSEAWRVFIAKGNRRSKIRLSEEHDRYEWVHPEIAIERCRPEIVSTPLKQFWEIHKKSLV